MPSYSPSFSSAYAELAIFGAALFPVSILIQLYIKSGPLLEFAPVLISAGSLLMMFGTLYFYFSKSSMDRFPDRFTILSVCIMAFGLAISLIQLFYEFSQNSVMLAGPAIFGYGFTIVGTQLFMKFKFRTRVLQIAAIVLMAFGVLLFYFAGLYPGGRFFSPGIIPIISGVYLLFVPVMMKNYRYWKGLGYFDGQTK